jgi:hypothetical protein
LEVASEHARNVKRVTVTLGVGIALMVAVGAIALTHAPARVVLATARGKTILASTFGEARSCQAEEVLPADISAIRVSLTAFFGARVRVAVFSGSRLLTEGRRGPQWSGTSVTVPLVPLSHAVSDVKLCLEVGPNSQPIVFMGIETTAGQAAMTGAHELRPGRIDVEYLTDGSGSWWSRLLLIARHMGLGHALTGTWVVLLIAALVAAVGALAVKLTLQELP